ncbi:MAG: hypothetical protein JW751_11765 [Polyangiaceae bacterium]|nr:hypothetical protein [Polyangiaceae bacterium]
MRVGGFHAINVRKLGRIASLGEEAGANTIGSALGTPAPGDWRGIYFEPLEASDDAAPPALLDLRNGQYLGGNLLYRTEIRHSGESGVRSDSVGFALIRSLVTENTTSLADNCLAQGAGVFIGPKGKEVLLKDSEIAANFVSTTSGSVQERFAGLVGRPTERRARRHRLHVSARGNLALHQHPLFRDGDGDDGEEQPLYRLAPAGPVLGLEHA